VVDNQMRADLVAESTDELLPAISDNIVCTLTFADNVFKKHLCPFWWVDIFSAAEVGCHICQSVDYYKDPHVLGNG